MRHKLSIISLGNKTTDVLFCCSLDSETSAEFNF